MGSCILKSLKELSLLKNICLIFNNEISCNWFRYLENNKNKISKHYFENLSNRFNHEIITVDPYNECDYKSIDDINFIDGKWFVTSPANTHHDILIELFNKGVKDIWVEKPICPTLKECQLFLHLMMYLY